LVAFLQFEDVSLHSPLLSILHIYPWFGCMPAGRRCFSPFSPPFHIIYPWFGCMPVGWRCFSLSRLLPSLFTPGWLHAYRLKMFFFLSPLLPILFTPDLTACL
jgi:hypothetical protein